MKKILFAILLMSPFVTSVAQAPGTGAYSHAPLDNRGFDQVNVGNLNVRFSIPIVSRQGRGMGFNYALHYEGLVWSQVTSGSVTSWTPDPDWGFHGELNGTSIVGYLTHTNRNRACPGPGHRPPALDEINFVYHDPFGATHQFNYSLLGDCDLGDPTVSGDGKARDGSGYVLLDTATVATKDSKIITPATSPTVSGSTSITDSNGNMITSSGTVMTDTLGVAALTIGGSPSSGVTFTYPVSRQVSSSTTSASVTVHYQTYTVRTNFGVSGVTEFGATTVSLPHDVTYPDNPSNKYIFNYEPTPMSSSGEVTGRLSSVTLPTGGVITYDYSGGSINGDGTPSKLVRTGGDGTRTYTRGSNTFGPTTLLTDNALNDTFFQLITDSTQPALFYSADRTSYSGGAGSGTVLAEAHYCFNGATPATASTNCDGQTLTLPITNVVTRSSQNSGSVATTTAQYDVYGQRLTASTDPLGNTTTLTYNGNGELASSTTVDPASHTLSQSNNYFDETAPIATSSIPQHGSPSGTRGNLTRTTAMVDGSTNLETKYTYYDTGALATSTATTTAGTATAGTTSYTYDPTQGFVTGVTFPAVPSGASLSTSASVDATSAAIFSSTGMDSGDSTSVDTYDAIMRPLKVTPAVPLKPITFTYSTNSVVTRRQLDATGSTLTDEETILDGFGRTIRTVQKATTAGTWYIRDYCYDTNGNLVAQSPAYSSSTAYPSSLACNSSPRTTYSYDALNRLHLVTYPDGSTKQIDIWSRAVRVTQDGVSRITQKDEAGRITDVCEVSSTSYGTDSPATCHLDIADTGYITTYRYDDPTHTVNIEQGNTTPGYKLRSFQTDAVGRTIKAVEPEVGTTQYLYTYNGTGLQVTRRKPLQFNSTTGTATPAGSTTTTDTDTQYDVLGRPVSITYHDGYTYNKHYYYDVSPAALGWTVSGTHTAGRLVDATTTYSSSAFAASHYGYYESGLMASMAQCTSNICGTANQQSRGTSSYSYDGAGRLATAFDLVTGSIGYTRNLAGQTEGIANFSYDLAGGPGTSTLVSSVVNTPFGPTSYTLGNLRAYSQTYDSSGRMNMQTVCGSASSCGTLLDRWLVNYSGRRVTSHCQIRSSPTFCGTLWTDSYDDLGRLSSSVAGSYSYTYTYDRYGNRTAQTGSSGPSWSRSYDGNNRLSTTSTSPYSYDAAGNVVTDGVTSNAYVYDADGNLVSDNTSFANNYDAMNQRIRMVQPGVARDYQYDLAGRRVSSWDGSTNAAVEGRIYWDGGLLAVKVAGGETLFEHSNWVGTQSVESNHVGNPTTADTAQAYGDNYGRSTYTTGSQDNSGFGGMDRDLNQTHHAQFRQYSANHGRWLSPDPYSGSYNPNNPQTLNRYSYALNHPLGMTDRTGLAATFCYSSDVEEWCEENGDEGGSGGGGDPGCADGNCVTVTAGPDPAPPAPVDPGPCYVCGGIDLPPASPVVYEPPADQAGNSAGQKPDVPIGIDIFHCPSCGNTWKQANCVVTKPFNTAKDDLVAGTAGAAFYGGVASSGSSAGAAFRGIVSTVGKEAFGVVAIATTALHAIGSTAYAFVAGCDE